jgi:SNF2 family DNA or RNA helicase
MDLYPYQRTGAEWLAARRRAILGDKMGLGKTPQAIRAADIAGARKVAVVCPAIARVNWQREFERWTVYSPELRVASYNQLADSRELRKTWAAWKPDVLIADEAHYLKTADSRRTKSLYGPYCRGDGLVSCAGAYWALSGTITPNHMGELYPHLRALWPGLLPGTGSYIDFLQRYTHWKPGTYGLDVLGNDLRTLPEIRAALAQHMLRRTPEQVAPDLPPVVMGELLVESSEAQAELRALEDTPEVQALRHKLDAGEPPPDSDPHLAAYRRICGRAKAAPIANQVAEELDCNAYDKVVLFAHHREVIEVLQQALAAHGAVVVHGGTSDNRRNVAIDAFQNEASCRVFIGQLQAASTAITLNSAHQCILVESSWTPADNEQAIYRLRRGLQKSKVHVRIAALAGSIDEAIQAVLARKTRALIELHED